MFLIVSAMLLNLSLLNLNQKMSKELLSAETQKRIARPWEKNIHAIVSGTPMERMTPYISQKEKRVAAFLVSVAKKESALGKYSPRLAGRDCYNYWGYRGQIGIITPSGYTCFKNPRQAVNIVGARFAELINESGLDTPQKMVVWKCGWDCSWDDPSKVDKWASDVDLYFQKFYE